MDRGGQQMWILDLQFARLSTMLLPLAIFMLAKSVDGNRVQSRHCAHAWTARSLSRGKLPRISGSHGA